jgi:hypothetical protein
VNAITRHFCRYVASKLSLSLSQDLHRHAHGTAAGFGAQNFPLSTSFRLSMASSFSASSRLSRAFSFSNSFVRREEPTNAR